MMAGLDPLPGYPRDFTGVPRRASSGAKQGDCIRTKTGHEPPPQPVRFAAAFGGPTGEGLIKMLRILPLQATPLSIYNVVTR